jgi:hypothetical protein
MKITHIIFLLIGAVSCVPVQQQISDSENNRLLSYELREIFISQSAIDMTLNPQDDEWDFPREGTAVSEKQMSRNFQSQYTILGLGNMLAGRLIGPWVHGAYYDNISEPFEIHRDFLLFAISYGGGASDTKLVDFQVIWDGKYYLTDDIPTVDLVFSFKDLNIERALINKYLRFDLTSLQSPQGEMIYINFVGINKRINYYY